MEYEGAIKSHKYNVDTITKSIHDIQQRNDRLMEIQKTVINSRRMYDRNIKVHFAMKLTRPFQQPTQITRRQYPMQFNMFTPVNTKVMSIIL